MKTNILVDKLLSSSVLSTSLFITSGCYKTYKDYKNASPKYKDRFLIKDCVVLSGAALGMLANHGISNKIGKSKIYNNAVTEISKKINDSSIHRGVKSSISYTTEIIKELTAGFMSTAAGILGALGADYLLSKTDFQQPKYNRKNPEKNKFAIYIDSNIAKFTDENTRDIFYTSVTDMPKMRFLSAGMIGADAIEIAKDREFDKRLKHTTGYLVNDTLGPLLFLSVSSALTKNLKSAYRIPVIFFSLFGGTLAAQKIFDKRVNNKK